MWHTFNYSSYEYIKGSAPPGVDNTRRPILQVELVAKARRVSIRSVLDSGADHCLFPLSLATELGINLGISIVAEGIGEWRMGMGSVLLEVPPLLSVGVTAGFTEKLERIKVGVLGQRGFFEHLDVLFEYSNGLFKLRKPRKR